MRLTNVLCKRNAKRMWKRLWKSRGQIVDHPLRLPSTLQDLEIVDPNMPGAFRKEVKDELVDRLKPKKSINIAIKPPKKSISIECEPKYNQPAVYVVTSGTRMMKGLEQSCILAKAMRIQGFPPSVENGFGAVKIRNQDSLVQRYIMQSQVWDPTMKKLPKRIDKSNVGWKFQREYGIPKDRSMTILLRNLIRLSSSLTVEYPELAFNRRLIYKPFIETNYAFESNMVNVRGQYEYLISGEEELKPFVGREDVEATAEYTLPDIYPISPLIDLELSHIYSAETVMTFQKFHTHSKPLTLFMLNREYWNNNQRQARAVQFCLATALAHARAKFGPDVAELSSPVCVQCINMNETTLNFVFFQLNTADLSSSDGIKNMVWHSNNHKLFVKDFSQPWKDDKQKTTYYDYDPQVFEKFVSVYLTGVNGVNFSAPEIDTSAVETPAV